MTTELRTNRKAADNMALPQWGVKCFYETFVHKQTVVHLLNICAKNPPLRQYPIRCLPCSTDIQQLSSLRLTAHDNFSIGLTQQQFIGITFFSFSTGTVNRRLKKMAGHHLQTLTS